MNALVDDGRYGLMALNESIGQFLLVWRLSTIHCHPYHIEAGLRAL